MNAVIVKREWRQRKVKIEIKGEISAACKYNEWGWKHWNDSQKRWKGWERKEKRPLTFLTIHIITFPLLATETIFPMFLF